MADLQNYVYMPLWLVITLTLFTGIGFEFLVYRAVRLMKRGLYGRTSGNVLEVKPKVEIISLAEHRTKAAEK